MINQIDEILEKRIKRDEELFYVDIKYECKNGPFIICSKKKYYGLYYDNDVVLNCIYDKIVSISNNLYALKINNKWGIYDCIDRCLLVDYMIDSYYVREDYGTIEIEKDGLIGLFSIEHKNIVIPIQYDEVTYYENCEYLWVRSNGVYGFVKKSTKDFIVLYDMVLGYDVKNGMFCKCKDGNVYSFSDEGYIDMMQFRHYILKNNGRGKFINYKYHVTDVTDIYGYIID